MGDKRCFQPNLKTLDVVFSSEASPTRAAVIWTWPLGSLSHSLLFTCSLPKRRCHVRRRASARVLRTARAQREACVRCCTCALPSVRYGGGGVLFCAKLGVRQKCGIELWCGTHRSPSNVCSAWCLRLHVGQCIEKLPLSIVVFP